MPCFESQFLLKEKHCALQSEHNNSKTVICYRCFRFFMTSTVKEKVLLFVCPGSQQNVFTMQRRSLNWQRLFQWGVPRVCYFPYYLGMEMWSMWWPVEKRGFVRAITYTKFCFFVYLRNIIEIACCATIFNQTCKIYSTSYDVVVFPSVMLFRCCQ